MATEVLPRVHIPSVPEDVREQIRELEGSIAPVVLERLDEDWIAQLNGHVSVLEIQDWVRAMPLDVQESLENLVGEAAELLWLRRDHGSVTDAHESERNHIDAQRVFYDIYHSVIAERNGPR